MSTFGWVVVGVFALAFIYVVWWILTRKNDGTDRDLLGRKENP
jgi:hypothetical protein